MAVAEVGAPSAKEERVRTGMAAVVAMTEREFEVDVAL